MNNFNHKYLSNYIILWSFFTYNKMFIEMIKSYIYKIKQFICVAFVYKRDPLKLQDKVNIK